MLNRFLSQKQNYKFWRRSLTPFMTPQGKTKRLKQHQKMWTFSNNGHAKFHLIWDNALVSANRVGGKAPTWDHRKT